MFLGVAIVLRGTATRPRFRKPWIYVVDFWLFFLAFLETCVTVGLVGTIFLLHFGDDVLNFHLELCFGGFRCGFRFGERGL
jgi:hypothetical protein